MDEAKDKYRLDPGNLEERSAVRFPLKLRVSVLASGDLYEATTENISSNGVLLRMSAHGGTIQPGTEVDFLIQISEEAMGSEETAAIHCQGRVVRAYQDEDSAHAAAVINEYRFQSEEGSDPGQ